MDNMGLGVFSVLGRSLVPLPPAIITTTFLRTIGEVISSQRCNPINFESSLTTGIWKILLADMISKTLTLEHLLSTKTGSRLTISSMELSKLKPFMRPLRISPSVTVPRRLKFESTINTILNPVSLKMLIASLTSVSGDRTAFFQISSLIILKSYPFILSVNH